MSIRAGTLYIVATPIGNLDDISARALQILQQVDLIAAEDTRHSKQLLSHYGISVPITPYHDFNERTVGMSLVEQLISGKDIALISDAGTPLINDPGYRLVKSAHAAGIRVIPIPGPSALICALSAGGLPTDKFVFEGYPPERHTARTRYLQTLKSEGRTMVFYETPHRIAGFIEDAVAVFGAERHATIAREMTKKFEEIRTSTLNELMLQINGNKIPQKGEFVVLIEGWADDKSTIMPDAERILGLLLQELPLKKAAAITAQITGINKNELYQLGLKIQDRQ